MGSPYNWYTYRSEKYGTESGRSIKSNWLCGGYGGGSSYTCSGNRATNIGRNIKYDNFLSGDTIDHKNISPFIDRINDEISERKKNGLYKNMTLNVMSDVNSGDDVLAEQPNRISELLVKLNSYIKGVSDYKFPDNKITDISSINGHPVLSGEICQPDDIKVLEKYINSQYNDCICYADCISYGYVRMCDCYGDCGCHYWW